MKEANQIIKNLSAGQYAPNYFLQGEEPYYIDLITGLIERNALDESAKGFNQVILYGKDVRMSDVLNNAKRFPMMSDRQVVIVKEAQNILDLGKEAGLLATRSQVDLASLTYADGFLVKPYRQDVLFTLVRKLLS